VVYGGVGLQLCRRLSSQGAKILMPGRDDVQLAAIASELADQSLIAANLKSTFAVLHSATKAMGQGGSIEL
jgi:NADP-dependent 3-hydroxy acid dehydrogenase YdfG